VHFHVGDETPSGGDHAGRGRERQRIAGLERDRSLTLAAPFGRRSPAYLEPAGPFCYSQYVKLKAGFILAA
jgi:hypothetical protein